MAKLKKIKKKSLVEDLKESVEIASVDRPEPVFDFGVVSTGSTLADLAISGKRIRGGGVPCGILMVISGPAKIGKTAILEEMTTSAQNQGGFTSYKDPEGRLDKLYAATYGIDIGRLNYSMPDTVKGLFTQVRKEIKENRENYTEKPNIICGDSLAALCSEMEWGKEKDGEGEDKRGQARAKEFSEELRKTCRVIANSGWLMACSNQERDGDRGSINPGGRAIPFYASLHLRLTPSFPESSKVMRGRVFHGRKIEKQIGVKTKLEVKYSSVDEPYREAPVYIIFGYGVDDVRANLQWYKEVLTEKSYGGMFNKSYRGIEDAITYVEENKLQSKLKEIIIDTWEEIEEAFKVDREEKLR